jgi:lipoic acid synthetase
MSENSPSQDHTQVADVTTPLLASTPAPISTKAPPLPKPSWLKVRASTGENYSRIKDMLGNLNLATVCQSARCPNIGECWNGGTATFMIMGDVCTRGCRFCNVKTGNPKGVLDPFEPEKIAYSISQMNLEYVVITTVDRDDLPDQGAEHFSRTVTTIKKLAPNLIVEILAGDFRGDRDLTWQLTDAKPDVYAHNIETVERLTPKVRDRRAGYRQTLKVLEMVKERDATRYTKTSLMLGLGETDEEILQTLKDLRSVGCDVVTFGQYLQPTKRHLKVEEYVTPEKFKEWQTIAEGMGYLYVASGPLVRSSYRAGEFFMKGIIDKQRASNSHA